MEEDEKEMLQEARARLANTKGKKAKRKAREKQLEEARRLASLQKRRELKAAGLGGSGRPHKVRGMDYNGEVPFLHRPAPGFFSTDEERTRELKEKAAETFTPTLLAKLEGQRQETQHKAKKRDVNALKDKIRQGESLQALAEHAQELKRRAPLSLPAPQLGEEELQALVQVEEGDERAPTAPLLAPAAPERTPLPERTPARPDTLRHDAQLLRSLQSAPTPLLGEEGPTLPAPAPVRTPAPARPPATPLRTPRDALRINDDATAPRDVRAGLAALPRPREYRIALPEQMDLEDAPAPQTLERDQADLDATQHALHAQHAALQRRLRSQVHQRALPVPRRPAPGLGKPAGEGASEEEQAQSLVQAELLRLQLEDATDAPPPDTLSEADLLAARRLLDAELADLQRSEGAPSPAQHAAVWDFCWGELLPVPGKITRRSLATEPELARALQAEHTALQAEHAQHAKRVGAAEKRLDVLHKGYRTVSAKKETELAALHQQLAETRLQGRVFAALRSLEQAAAPLRVEAAQAELEGQRSREADLQARYAELTRTKEALLQAQH